MVLESILDPIFSPLLTLPSWLAILVISAVITGLTTVAYKYLTDQVKMKKLKSELKSEQKKMKELSRTDPQKAMKMQKDLMGKNMELMKQSFKPTLYTIIPIIIIFGWLNAHLAYEPLMPGQPFTVTVELQKGFGGEVELSATPPLQLSRDDSAVKEVVDGEAMWTLRGDAGEYRLSFEHSSGGTYDKDIIISPETGDYAQPLDTTRDVPYKTITVGNQKIRPLEGFPLVGNWGWIGIYILFSLIISFGLRKAMKVA